MYYTTIYVCLCAAQYDRHLAILQVQKDELLKRTTDNTEWSKNYDSDVGPFAEK